MKEAFKQKMNTVIQEKLFDLIEQLNDVRKIDHNSFMAGMYEGEIATLKRVKYFIEIEEWPDW